MFKSLLREGPRVCFTFQCQEHLEQMTIDFVIVTWHILYFLTQWFPVQCPEGEICVNKFMPQILVGLECFQSHLSVRHMRLCSCCLIGTVYYLPVYAAMPKR